MNPWEQKLMELLCALWKSWTDKPDCSGLFETTAAGRAQEILDYYAEHGTELPPPASIPAFLAALAALQSHLNQPGNTLPAALTSQLLAMIAALQAAAGGNP